MAGLSLRDRVRSSDIRKEIGVELLLLGEEPVEVVWHLVRMPPAHLPR